MKIDLTANDISKMSYVDFLAILNETNRPPGGKDSVRRLAINSFINSNSKVLHSGCNTGFCSFEISHLVKCKVSAIDINSKMIASANGKLKKDLKFFQNRISFQVADAHKLPFKNDSYDLIFSGGSTAFMKDPVKVVREYKRTCKPYGFIGDICLYYKKKPPVALLNKINSMLNIQIKAWDKQYWISLYTNEGLEIFYDYSDEMPYHPSNKEVRGYCCSMIQQAFPKYASEVKQVAEEKLYSYMNLFNENHKYLAYSVFLFRKDLLSEQVTLFGK